MTYILQMVKYIQQVSNSIKHRFRKINFYTTFLSFFLQQAMYHRFNVCNKLCIAYFLKELGEYALNA